MVMARSRSRSVLSIARSATRSLARKVPLWCSIASTSVVLPWSTWAMMATLRRRGLAITIQPVYCTHDSTPNDRRLPQSRQQVSRAIAELLVVDDALGILPSVAGTRQVVERDCGVEPRRRNPAAAGRDALLPFRDFPILACRRVVTGANLGDLGFHPLFGFLQAARGA